MVGSLCTCAFKKVSGGPCLSASMQFGRAGKREEVELREREGAREEAGGRGEECRAGN